MKTQKDLEKLQREEIQSKKEETVALTFSPKIIIGIVIAVIAIIVIVMVVVHSGKKKNTPVALNPSVMQSTSTESTDSSSDSTSSKREEYKLYKDGEMAEIDDPNGKLKFGVTEATILKETRYRDAVYQLTWVTENKSYTNNLGTGTSAYDFKIVDSDGFIVEAMNEGWQGDWSNNYEEDQPKVGEKCKSKHTYVINNPECTYLDVSIDKYKVTCRVNISNQENGISSIPEEATDEQIKIIKAAQSYAESCNMSYNSIVAQLEYEGYTNEEAKYGADNCGVDWNGQAVKSAKSYMDDFNFTKDKMIIQLEEGEGFTHDQAVYGAEHCGQY